MRQLGVRKLRPGPSGNESAPNHANYDEATANPFPNLPEVLTLKNGTKVTTPAMWWNQRRPEIVEDFDREVLGRVPKNVPKVTWTVTNTVEGMVGPYAAIGKQLVGHVDNSSYPAINVDIQMTLVTPADVKGTGARHDDVRRRRAAAGSRSRSRSRSRRTRWRRRSRSGADPPATQQLLAAGWGYASINPGSIQADNGAGLTKGIIGLVNKGQPRKPDDWGSLRAWAMGRRAGPGLP